MSSITDIPLPSFPSPVEGVARHKRKLRSACDFCHQAKVKCSGGTTCSRCASQGLSCHYGYQNRTGKPKGSKNKKTIERLQRMGSINCTTGSLHQPPKQEKGLPSQLQQTGFDKSRHGQPVAGGDATLDVDMYDFFPMLPTPDVSPPSHLNDGSESFETSIMHKPIDDVLLANGTHHRSNSSHDEWTMNLGAGKSPVEEDYEQQDDRITPASLPPREDELGITSSGGSCFCVANQTANLKALHQLSISDDAGFNKRIDTVMQTVSAALGACTQFLNCTACGKTYPSILLSLSALHIVFELFEQQLVTSSKLSSSSDECELDGHHNVICRLGTYEVSKEESMAVRHALLKMALQKGEFALVALRKTIGGALQTADSDDCKKASDGAEQLFEDPLRWNYSQNDSEYSTGGGCVESYPTYHHGQLSPLDREYIMQCINRKEAVLEVFMRMLRHQTS